jgi:biopolymer transport protein ExbD
MRAGVVTRLIDVVLILLFGFISISEIDRRSPVRLAETKDIPITKVDKEQILVISVLDANNFLVEKKDGIRFGNIGSLCSYIESQKVDYARRDKEMKVRIRSNWFLPAKHALDIAIFCESIKVERGLDVRVTSDK